MEKLKALFGNEALTWEQLESKLKDSKEIKLANLASGGYVDKKKFDDKVTELETANNTITGLRETVTKFDGVDVERLKADAKEWEAKYNTDIEAVKLDSAVDLGIVAAKAKNPKLIKAALDMSLIKRDGENVIGLSEQLDNLKKSDGYLFEEEQQQDNGGARVNTGAAHTGNTNTDTFMSALMKGAGLEMNEKE
ncbi:MAG: phage scaffolding protein [Clostridia bacterium]|nr:phage scaffolding protein [Clostridia bacterium]